MAHTEAQPCRAELSLIVIVCNDDYPNSGITTIDLTKLEHNCSTIPYVSTVSTTLISQMISDFCYSSSEIAKFKGSGCEPSLFFHHSEI